MKMQTKFLSILAAALLLPVMLPSTVKADDRPDLIVENQAMQSQVVDMCVMKRERDQQADIEIKCERAYRMSLVVFPKIDYAAAEKTGAKIFLQARDNGRVIAEGDLSADIKRAVFNRGNRFDMFGQ